MTKQQRFAVRMQTAEKIMDWGNLGFASLVFGQAFLPMLNMPILVVGFVVILSAYILAIFIMFKGGV